MQFHRNPAVSAGCLAILSTRGTAHRLRSWRSWRDRRRNLLRLERGVDVQLSSARTTTHGDASRAKKSAENVSGCYGVVVEPLQFSEPRGNTWPQGAQTGGGPRPTTLGGATLLQCSLGTYYHRRRVSLPSALAAALLGGVSLWGLAFPTKKKFTPTYSLLDLEAL